MPGAFVGCICQPRQSAAVSRSQLSRSQQGDDMNLKHSGMGIASFIISLVVGFAIFVAIIIAGVMETSTPGGLDENSPEAMLLGLVLIALLFADVAALGLGVAGLFQRERRKVFAILGTIFAGTAVLGTIALIVIGNSMA